MSAVTILGVKLWGSSSEKEIDRLFDDYKKMLTTQKTELLNRISQWKNELFDRILQHEIVEKNSVEQTFERQHLYLQQTHQRFLDELIVYERLKNHAKIDELIDRCRHLVVF